MPRFRCQSRWLLCLVRVHCLPYTLKTRVAQIARRDRTRAIALDAAARRAIAFSIAATPANPWQEPRTVRQHASLKTIQNPSRGGAHPRSSIFAMHYDFVVYLRYCQQMARMVAKSNPSSSCGRRQNVEMARRAAGRMTPAMRERETRHENFFEALMAAHVAIASAHRTEEASLPAQVGRAGSSQATACYLSQERRASAQRIDIFTSMASSRSLRPSIFSRWRMNLNFPSTS
jgi:hypothetical protein